MNEKFAKTLKPINEQEGIYFPPFFEHQKLSPRLNAFFETNNIRSSDIYFNIHLLRQLYDFNYPEFELILDELIIKGFNFITERQKSLFPPSINYQSVNLLQNQTKGILSSGFLYRVGLIKTFSRLNFYERDYLSYIPIERIQHISQKTKILLNNPEAFDFKIHCFSMKLQEEPKTYNSSKNDKAEKRINNQENKIESYFKPTTEKEIYDSGLFHNEYKLYKKVIENNNLNMFELSSSYNESGMEYCTNGTLFSWLYFIIEGLIRSPQIMQWLLNHDKINYEKILQLDETQLKILIDEIHFDYAFKQMNENKSFLEILNKFVEERTKCISDLEDALLNDISKDKIEQFLFDFSILLENESISQDVKEKLIKIRRKYFVFSYTKKDFSKLIFDRDYNQIVRMELETFDDIGISKQICATLKSVNLKSLDDLMQLFTTKLNEFPNLVERDFLLKNVPWLWIIRLIDRQIKNSTENIPIDVETFLRKEEKFWTVFSKSYYFNRLDKKYGNNYDRMLQILEGRDQGITLEQLGHALNITRERIRQIESKACLKGEDVFKFYLEFLTINNLFVDLEVLKNYTGLITYINHQKNTTYYINKELNCMYKMDKEKHTINSLMNIFEKKVISKTEIDDLNKKNELNISKLLLNKTNYYEVNNNYYNLDKHSLREIASLLLLKLGQKGYNDETKDWFYKEFLKTTNKDDVSERNIITYIEGHSDAIYRGTNSYIHANYITEEQINVVKEIISLYDFSNRQFRTKTIYDDNMAKLQNIGINDFSFLYGIIKGFNIGDLIGSGISMKLGKSKHGTYQELIENYLADHGHIITKNELMNRFGIGDIQITNLLNSRILLRWDNDLFIGNKHITYSQEEKKCLKEYIEKILIRNNGVTSIIEIYNEIKFDYNLIKLLDRYSVSKDNMQLRLLVIINIMFKEFAVNNLIKLIFFKDMTFNSYYSFIDFMFKDQTFTVEDLTLFLKKHEIKTNINYYLAERCIQYDEERYFIKREIENQEELKFIGSFIEQEFVDEVFVHYKEIINRLHIKGHIISDKYKRKAILLISLLSSIENSSFCRPKKDYNQLNSFLPTMLMNVRLVGSDSIKEGIKCFIKLNTKSNYITFEDINQMLIDDEIISKPLTESTKSEIFDVDQQSFFIEVNKI